MLFFSVFLVLVVLSDHARIVVHINLAVARLVLVELRDNSVVLLILVSCVNTIVFFV